jgi:hypothetical protein
MKRSWGVTGINRRNALGIGAAGIAAFNMRSARAQMAAPALTAVVTISGRSYEFHEETGQDLGDYTPPSQSFVQRCVRAEVPNFPMTVFFRPDRNSDRVEVVFELGRVFSQTPANLGAYTAVISRGAQVLARIDVPEHYWFARWRWQSSPRPVVADPKQLMHYGLLPPYDLPGKANSPAQAMRLMPLPSGDYVDLDVVTQFTSGNYENASKLLMKSAEYQSRTTGAGNAGVELSVGQNIYSVMRLAGVQAYMPNTGERADIGPVTEPQAKFLQTWDQGAFELLMAQAEAAGTMPWHIRDERQAGPFDFRQYPNASWYGAGNPGAPQVKTADSPVTLDSAHQPALSYVPFLLTEDAYFLEELQFQATWNWGSLPPQYRPSGAQPRLLAWNLRTLAQCARSTQTVTPLWLLDSHYWKAQLDQTRQWFEQNYVYSDRPERQRFHVVGAIDNGRGEPLAPEGTWVDPWQDEFLATILGWVIYMGFSEWRPAFQWVVRSTIERTSGGSGWVRAHATPYRVILRASKNAPIAQSWAEAWELTKSIAGKTVADSDTWADDDMTYLTYTRGALVYATKLGMVEAAEPLAWATKQLKSRKWNVAAKWRFGEGL